MKSKIILQPNISCLLESPNASKCRSLLFKLARRLFKNFGFKASLKYFCSNLRIGIWSNILGVKQDFYSNILAVKQVFCTNILGAKLHFCSKILEEKEDFCSNIMVVKQDFCSTFRMQIEDFF